MRHLTAAVIFNIGILDALCALAFFAHVYILQSRSDYAFIYLGYYGTYPAYCEKGTRADLNAVAFLPV